MRTSAAEARSSRWLAWYLLDLLTMRECREAYSAWLLTLIQIHVPDEERRRLVIEGILPMVMKRFAALRQMDKWRWN